MEFEEDFIRQVLVAFRRASFLFPCSGIRHVSELTRLFPDLQFSFSVPRCPNSQNKRLQRATLTFPSYDLSISAGYDAPFRMPFAQLPMLRCPDAQLVRFLNKMKSEE